MEKIFAVHPGNIAWLQAELSQPEVNFLWDCIDKKKEKFNNKLAGNIDSSFLLEDTENWFFNSTLEPLIGYYLDLNDNPPNFSTLRREF
jgi:hypothetical protein